MKPRYNGVTLVELMVVLALLGILAALAAPSMADMWNRRRVAAVANEIATDLAFARSEAVAKGVNILIQYKKNGTMSCYTVHHKATMGACDCMSSTAVCDAETTSGIEVKTVQIPSNLGVSFESTFAPVPGGQPASAPLIEYSFPHFTPNPANFLVDVTGRNGVSMQVQVNAMGRIKTCSPNGTMPGVAAC